MQKEAAPDRLKCKLRKLKKINGEFAFHDVRYNCSIIDRHDRSVTASITDRHITSGLAIRTLQKALNSQPAIKGELSLHSEQGPQYTSKAFTEFCKSVNVAQSMSKAG